MHVVGLDISFRSTGVVSASIGEDNSILLSSCFVIETEKNSTSEKVSNTVDNLRRAQKIYKEMQEFLSEAKPDIIVVESQSWPRNASSALKMALAWGAIAPLLEGIPLIEVGPQDIKLLAAGSRSASKQDVQRGVLNLVPSSQWVKQVVASQVPKASLQEHCYDALGAVLAAQRTEKYQLLRAASQRP